MNRKLTTEQRLENQRLAALEEARQYCIRQEKRMLEEQKAQKESQEDDHADR